MVWGNCGFIAILILKCKEFFMRIEDFEYLIMVQEYGSISAAAKKLFMTQPQLSQKIRNMELKLGVTIFDRSNYPMRLTYAGEQVLQSAMQIKKVKDDLENQISDLKGEAKGSLRIGMSAHRSIVLTRILPEYQQRYPKVEISVHEHTPTSFTNLLLDKQVDFALISQDEFNQSTELNYEFLHKDRVMLFCGPGTEIARRKKVGETIRIREVANETFIFTQKHFGFRTSQDRMFARQNIHPSALLTVHSIELACRLAVACNCVTLCPEANPLETAHLKENACYFPICEKDIIRNFSLAYRKDTFITKYMQEFIERVKKAYQD